MKKSILTALAFACCVVSGGNTYAQKAKEKRADKTFEQFEYVNAIEVYERIVAKGYKSVNTLSKLGDAYYFKGELKQANGWYKELFALASQKSTTLPSEYYYRYAQTFRALEDYVNADKYLSEFAQLEKFDSRGVLFEAEKDTYLKTINATIKRYELQSLPINSQYSDYGTALLDNNLVFTSARETEDTREGRRHNWTNEAFTNLYVTQINSDGDFSEPELFDKQMRTKVNEASAIFTKDGQTMYFTRNNSRKGKKVHNQDYAILLKLYKATREADGSWSEAVELPFNSDDFNTAHPALSPDEKVLYFVSDRDGSIGQSDLFKVSIHEDGSFSEPINLGKKINTEGKETFPFVSADNMLYFSSDGRPGLGGLDVYKAKINVDGSFGKVVNVGAPINTAADDFAFFVDANNRKGFVSSNREGGHGNDDIYFFKVVDCKQQIKGTVFDNSKAVVIPKASVVLYDSNYKELGQYTTNANGEYITESLPCNFKYRIKASATGYQTNEVVTVLGKEFDAFHELNIGLDPIVEKIEKNDDLFKKLKLEPIYFDFDKSNIRPDAAIELAKIVEVLEMYPALKIDVRSHTDSRGNDAYNMKLSDRRAKSTIAWIIAQGIAPERVSGKGYGESDLTNKCKNKVPCTIQEHQANRRSEFIILDL
ncbi:OmpA family protein [Myroides pelagicus]|uniref:OmpA family protein n=1 Tax=Myroides pelagicus TaxID=270914 RepID=A0A7K1GL26_9FLAO|nr:OmpA family protein [Myroides pelagicus]MTH29239.1 OmpA family protein [Myroides pelagicus]